MINPWGLEPTVADSLGTSKQVVETGKGMRQRAEYSQNLVLGAQPLRKEVAMVVYCSCGENSRRMIVVLLLVHQNRWDVSCSWLVENFGEWGS